MTAITLPIDASLADDTGMAFTTGDVDALAAPVERGHRPRRLGRAAGPRSVVVPHPLHPRGVLTRLLQIYADVTSG